MSGAHGGDAAETWPNNPVPVIEVEPVATQHRP